MIKKFAFTHFCESKKFFTKKVSLVFGKPDWNFLHWPYNVITPLGIMGAPPWNPWYHIVVMHKGFSGARLIEPPWDREDVASRKAVRLIVAYFLFCWVEFLSTEKWFSFSCWIRFHLKLLTIYGMQLNQIPFGSKTNGGWMYTSTVLFKREYPSAKFRLY